MMQYQFHTDGTLPPTDDAIWVFGSNQEGRHGKGAALVAIKRFGAVRGKGAGKMGQSYAIPTRSTPYRSLDLETIHRNVELFKLYARVQPNEIFWITRIACGHAGYADMEIAPMFRGAPNNCNFAEDWRKYL